MRNENGKHTIYIFDFGIHPSLNMIPLSEITSKNPMFANTGYLSMFSSANTIEL